MSQPQAPSPSEEWLQIARKDFKRAKRNLEDSDVEAAGFFLQQSLEKYLKAFLLRHGWLLKKIHTLHVLLDEAIQYLPRLDEFYSLCERVLGVLHSGQVPALGGVGFDRRRCGKGCGGGKAVHSSHVSWGSPFGRLRASPGWLIGFRSLPAQKRCEALAIMVS